MLVRDGEESGSVSVTSVVPQVCVVVPFRTSVKRRTSIISSSSCFTSQLKAKCDLLCVWKSKWDSEINHYKSSYKDSHKPFLLISNLSPVQDTFGLEG